MIDIAKLIAANAARWQAMHMHQELIAQVDRVVTRLWTPTTKPRYQAIAAAAGLPIDDNGTHKAVKQLELSPIIFSAIQQLKADNDNLKAEVEALKRAGAR